MIRLTIVFFFLSSVVSAQVIQEQALKYHVSHLSSDKLEGRGTGTEGERKAGNYIVKNFREAGLEPYRGQRGFRQEFLVKKGNQGEVTARNILGYIDNGQPYTIIIGAHYDHLGRGEQGSLLQPDSEGEIHNGADDSASGVAGMLELNLTF